MEKKMGNGKLRVTRRTVLAGGLLAGTAALSMPYVRRAGAAEPLLVGLPGGHEEPMGSAWFKPFTDETGITIVPVVMHEYPYLENKIQVDTGSYKWHVGALITQEMHSLMARDGTVQPLEISGPQVDAIAQNLRAETWIALGIFAFCAVWQTAKYPGKTLGLNDLWSVEGFPGRRGMRKRVQESVEMALRADGVAPKDIYMILSTEEGWTRAFAKLDEIKPHISVWWDSDTVTQQLLTSGELDICPTNNHRAQVLIDNGIPLSLGFDQSFYQATGFAIPKGSPQAESARRFIEFALTGERLAAYIKQRTFGPANPEALNFLDPALAKNLPTFPENFAKITPLDYAFWTANIDQANERFNAWLLQ